MVTYKIKDVPVAGDNLAPQGSPPATNGTNGTAPFAAKKSASAFLGENSALVNLERLLQPASPDPPAPNPFASDAPRHMFQPPPPVTPPLAPVQQRDGCVVFASSDVPLSRRRRA